MNPNIARAAAAAIEAHGEQKYGAKCPYVVHLARVVQNLHHFGVATDDLVAAAWLHDTVEDTDLTLEEVREQFGDRVAALVDAVTTVKLATREESNAATYPRIAATPDAVKLKLADRIANVETCWSDRHHKLFRYHDEYPKFREALRRQGDHVTDAMWAHLDELLGFRG